MSADRIEIRFGLPNGSFQLSEKSRKVFKELEKAVHPVEAGDFFAAQDELREGGRPVTFKTSSVVTKQELTTRQQELRQAWSFFYPDRE